MTDTLKNNDLILDIILQETDAFGVVTGRLNYGTLPGMMIIMYQNISKPLYKWSKVIPVGPSGTRPSPIKVTDASQGEIYIYIPRSITKVMTTAEFYILTMVALTDADAEDEVFYPFSDPIKVSMIKDSIGRDQIIPVT